jgi:putative ABC transport system permease protein
LGAAVVVSIDLVKQSAQRAFDLSSAAITGKATHRIIGGPAGIDESLYLRLRMTLGVRPSAPVVEGHGHLPDQGHTPLQVLGLDPFAERPFRNYLETENSAGARIDLTRFLTRPGAALLSADTAARLRLKQGDTLALLIGGQRQALEIVGIIEGDEAGAVQSLDDWLIVDIASAQELFGMPGRLSRIELILPPDTEGEARLDTLRNLLPPGVEIVSASSRGDALQQMTRAFYQHLTALSLLALLVGVFLIYNTMSFVVIQRRRLLGLLRALGVTRRQVFLLILVEAGTLGALGTILGLLMGIALAQGLLGMVTRTINDIYFVLSVRELVLDPLSLLKASALGIVGSVTAACVPAMEAAGVTPQLALYRSQIETRAQTLTSRSALAGIAVIGCGAILLVVSTQSIALGFIALFVVIVGFALLTPAATRIVATVGTPLLGRYLGLLGKLAGRGISAALSRTAVAIAALMLAVATTIGIGLMIGSFRGSVADWLEQLLRADFYVAAADGSSDTATGLLDRHLAQAIRRLPGVTDISTARRFTLTDNDEITHLVAYEFTAASYAGFHFIEGDPEQAWRAFKTEDAVIVSEPYAYRHGLHLDGRITLRTERGHRPFRIAGVYRDYTTDRGLVAMSRRLYERYWNAPGYSSIGVYITPGTDDVSLRTAILKLAAEGPEISINSNRAIRRSSLQLFDRTFAITEVLRLLAGAVAFVGIVCALMALQLDRTRELGVLRACGLTPAQLWRTLILETGLMGGVAGLLAIPVGSVMAALLVYAINRRSFGWSMSLQIDLGIYAQGLALAILAALLAGVYPAWRMAKTSPAEALRYE